MNYKIFPDIQNHMSDIDMIVVPVIEEKNSTSNPDRFSIEVKNLLELNIIQD